MSIRVSRITIAALLWPIVFATSSTWAQSPSVNTSATSGQFSISQSGAANYRIPIQVPPGVAGMEPKLELAYNSQRGNGMFGLGWGLSGLSAITRCGQTLGQDGLKGSVNFDANDRFCLDGQRLILVGGSYGVAGSEYRTEIDSFSKIVANGATGNGPASFTVQTKAGLTLEYGNTTDSRVLAVKSSASTANWQVGNVRTWAQNKAADRLGNTMTLSYDQDSTTGAYYPQRIDYTGNATSTPARAPSASLQFVSDTTRLDTAPVYMAGALFNSTKRINALRAYIGANLVKEYRLAYAAQSTSLDKSKPISVTECDGIGACLPPVSLTWGSPGTNAFAASTTALSGQYGTAQGWSDNTTFPRFMVDVNGDGLPDIVGFSGGGVYVALNYGDGTFAAPSYGLNGQYGTAQGWTDNNTYPRLLVDVNGDGFPDVVGFSGSGVYVALNNKNGTFAAPSYWLSNQFSPAQGYVNNSVNPRFLADVNGDGLPDIVGFDATDVYVSLNTGTGGFAAPTYWLSGQFGVNQGWVDSSTNPRDLVDINGDGLLDLVGFAGGGVSVAINTGSGFETASSTAANYSCLSGRTLIGSACGVPAAPVMGCPAGMLRAEYDIGFDCYYLGNNFQHYAPVIVGYACAAGTLLGSSCTIPANYSCPTGYTLSGSLCGLNIVGGGASGMWASAQFGVTQGWVDNKTAPRTLIDINGDGLPDIVGFGPSGVMVSLNTGAGFAPALNWLSAQYGIAQGWTDNNVTPRQLVDINGDGLPDIVGFGPNGVMVSLNTGTTFAAPISWNTAFGSSAAAGSWVGNSTTPRMVVDVNGDGLPDIVGFSGSSVMVASNSRSLASNYVANVTDSLGASIAPSYSALTAGKATNSSIYTKDSGANAATFPKVDMAAPYYVVSGVAKSNGVGGSQITSYTYGGLKFEAASGRGMLGFRWFKAHDQQTGIERYSEYNQNWPTTGLPTLSETRLFGSGNAGVLQRTVVTLGCQIPKTTAACAVAAGNTYFPYAAQTVQSGWDMNGTAMPVTTSTYTYGQSPQFGDPTQTAVATNDGASKTTLNAYYPPDSTHWIVGRLQSATTTSVKP